MSKTQQNPIDIDIENATFQELESLIKSGVYSIEPDQVKLKLNTLLYTAISDYPDQVKPLLDLGTEINALNKDGNVTRL